MINTNIIKAIIQVRYEGWLICDSSTVLVSSISFKSEWFSIESEIIGTTSLVSGSVSDAEVLWTIDNNITNYEFIGKIINEDSNLILYFTEIEVNPIIINKIEFTGNSITKDKTLRSKLPFLPGDYVKKSQLNNTKRKLNNLPFINNVIIEQSVNDNISDLTIKIDENKKTGSVLAAASFSGDTGAGLSFGLKDYNILGATMNKVENRSYIFY